VDCLTFVSNLIDATAWPIAAITIVFMLRGQLGPVLENLRKLKAGSFEAEFEKLEEIAEAAKEKAEVVAQKFDEQDDEEEDSLGSQLDLSENEKLVLEAMTQSQYAMRSVTGVSKQTKLQKSEVNTIYTELIGKGMLMQTTNKDGKLRWYPTNLGRKAVSGAS